VSRRDDEELMAFMDGELPPRDAREVEARLEKDPEAKQKLAALSEMSGLVREHYEHETSEIDPKLAGMWARLEAQLDAEPVARKPARAEERGGFLAWLADVFAPRTLVVGVVGAAAGVLMTMAVLKNQRPINVKVEMTAPTPPPAPVLQASAPTQVDELDVQAGSAMVFQVPSEDNGPATTVVWVTEDTPAEEPI
jgi:negative regulator of sigma E activity